MKPGDKVVVTFRAEIESIHGVNVSVIQSNGHHSWQDVRDVAPVEATDLGWLDVCADLIRFGHLKDAIDLLREQKAIKPSQCQESMTTRPGFVTQCLLVHDHTNGRERPGIGWHLGTDINRTLIWWRWLDGRVEWSMNPTVTTSEELLPLAPGEQVTITRNSVTAVVRNHSPTKKSVELRALDTK